MQPRPAEPTLSDLLAAIRQRIKDQRAAASVTSGDSAGGIADSGGGRPHLTVQMPLPKGVDRSRLVSIWPAMSRLAIAGGLGPEYRMWCAAQWIIQHNGHGWVTVDQLVDATGCTPNTVRRLLETGSGIFWRGTLGSGPSRKVFVVGQVDAQRSVRRLADAAGLYEASEPERSRWQVTVDQCSGSLGEFYAACFAGWVGVRDGFGYRVSWEVLQQAWGRSRTQINEWIDLAGIDKHPNRGCMEISESHYAADIAELFWSSGVPFRIDHHDGKRFVYFMRANTYKTVQRWRRVASRGKWYKINRLDSAGVSGGKLINGCEPSTAHDVNIAGSASERSAVAEFTRHNFTRVDAYRAAGRKRIGYRYLLAGESRRGGMWEYTME